MYWYVLDGAGDVHHLLRCNDEETMRRKLRLVVDNTKRKSGAEAFADAYIRLCFALFGL